MSTSPDPLVLKAISAVPNDELLAFLSRQRWFGAKGGAPSNARIATAVVAPWGDGAFAIARVTVQVGSGEQMYQLPLAAYRAHGAAAGGEQRLVATVDVDGEKVSVADAVHDENFRGGLVTAIGAGASAENGTTRWIAEAIVAGEIKGKSHVGSAEQSNTSITIGDEAILKLFRSLKAGIHPDVEVTEFLTNRAGFANTPRLRASMRFEDGDTVITSGMVQDFLPGSSDAWSYALERGKEYFAAPPGRDVPNRFVDDAKRLGAITRAMHEALATDDDDPAFAPEPIAPEDLDRWAHRTQQTIREALTLLARQVDSKDFPGDRLAEARALVARRDHYLGWVNEIDDGLGEDVGARIRIHGDYHLGQVLRTASNDFMIIDFEGEPSRSLEERREKTSPLRDVAGMLRSFAYAAATLVMSVEKQIDASTRELRVGRWERDVRAAYLAGYLAPVEDEAAEILPEDESHVRLLIALFEMEKAFYELTYELNNRPAWAWIPMRGISKLASRV